MKSPSPAQMRALQQLRAGNLVIRTPSHSFLNDLLIEGGALPGWPVHEVTARKLIENGWVSLAKFNSRSGEYRLTAAGKKLTDEFCECPKSKLRKFRFGRSIAAGDRKLCRRCWRVASES